MASSIQQTQVTWSGSNSVTINSTAVARSDTVLINAEDWDASLQVTADNQGTPASGDTCEVYIEWSSDGGTTWDTYEYSTFLGVLNTYPNDTPGEDPARRTFNLPVSGKSAFRVVAYCAQAGSRNVVVSARLNTHRPQ
jgi:hypothetical protein